MLERRWWALIAVCLGTFMLLLDITIVNVALPDIQRALGSSFADLQWVVDAYALTLAALLLTAGSLADIFGSRRVFVVGLGLFTAASLLCGLASSPLFLNLARGAQGIGGAAMFATSLALLAQEFQGRERGTAFGAWGATIGAAVAIGPLVGGALTDGLGWEWIFLVNVPIGIGTIALTLARVRESLQRHRHGVDWPGAVTFSGSLFLFVLALIRGNADGWTSTSIIARFAGAAVLMTAFIVIERRRAEPMFDVMLLRKPAFAGASITAFALSASMFSMFLYLTLYIQNVLGYKPLQAGLRFLPITLVSFFVAPFAGRLTTRLPIRAMLGGGLVLVGLGLLLMHGLTPGSSWTALVPGFVCAGAGIGLVNPTLATAAIAVVEPQRSGMASGINTTFRQVGIATGIAALGAVFQHRVVGKADALFAAIPGLGSRAGDLAQLVGTGGTRQAIEAAPAPLRGAVGAATRQAFVGGLNEILLIAMAVAFAGAVAALLLVRGRDFVASGAPAHAGAEEATAAA